MNFASPHFADPAWLWLAFLGPAATIALHVFAARRRQKQLASIAAPEVLSSLTASHSPARRILKEAFLVLVVAGIGFTLARPQWGERRDSSQVLAEDVIFILDCSRSMLASDVSPNRLQRAKLAILDHIQSRGKGRVGLVAFSGQAFLQCPLTFDYAAFQDSLAAIDDKTILVPGTDIGRALDEAFLAMDKSEGRKLMILLTDGEDLEKAGVQMAQKLKKEGVVVFTLGVGTPAGAEIQLINEQGQSVILRDEKGQVVRSRLDEATLKSIAKTTEGAYYSLGPLGEGLAKVSLAIKELDGTGGGAPDRRTGVDRYYVPLAGVLVLLVTESVLGTRRRVSRGSL